MESFVAEAERRVQNLALPAGVTFTFSGAHEIKQAAQRELLLLGSAAGAGILLILWMAFGSLRRLLLVLCQPAVRPGRRRGGGLHDGRRSGRRLAGRAS